MATPQKEVRPWKQGLSLKGRRSAKFTLPGTLSLLVLSSFSIAAPTLLSSLGLPAFTQAAYAQAGSRFAVGQQIVVKLDNEYFFATVEKIHQQNGFTMLDFSWELNDGGGGEGTYPADHADLFSVEEAKRRNFTIANAKAGNPAGNTTAGNVAPQPNPVAQPIAGQPPAPVAQPAPAAPVVANNGSSACSGSNQLTQAEIQEILRVHNAARAEVNVPPLKWNCKLADFAQNWVNRDVWKHSSSEEREKIIAGSYAGENLAAMADSTAKIATGGPTMWWEEKPFWNNATGTCEAGKVCGHYTQMVWRNTTEVGCGLNRKASVLGDEWKQNTAFLSCVYNPGGNMGGEKPY